MRSHHSNFLFLFFLYNTKRSLCTVYTFSIFFVLATSFDIRMWHWTIKHAAASICWTVATRISFRKVVKSSGTIFGVLYQLNVQPFAAMGLVSGQSMKYKTAGPYSKVWGCTGY